MVFQGSFKDVSRKFYESLLKVQGCFKEVERVFQRSFTSSFRGISRVFLKKFERCVREVSMVLKRCSRKFKKSVKDV